MNIIHKNSDLVEIDESRILTEEKFYRLADVPPEMEWFANLESAQTRRAYKNDISEFMQFTGIKRPEEFRVVTRAHILAWRSILEERLLAGSSIRRKMAALSSLFEYLCEKNAVSFNPVKGAKRPKVETNEGKTPAMSDQQARDLINAPDLNTLQGKRDRAMFSTFLYHGLRREELCKLKVRDIHLRRGVPFLRVHGKGSKIRYVPLHPGTNGLLVDYLEAAGHTDQLDSPLFLPVKDNVRSKDQIHGITIDGVYWLLKYYAAKANINIHGVCLHSLRATAATNALDNDADIAKVQEWLGHANIATTRIYDHRKTRPEDSPTFKVQY